MIHKAFILATALELFALQDPARDVRPPPAITAGPNGIQAVSFESRNSFDRSVMGKGTNSFDFNQGLGEPPFTCPQLKIIDEDDLFDELDDCD